MKKLTINPSIWTHTTAQSWLDFTNGLRQQRATKAAKSVPEVTITFGAKIVVRVARDKKELTTAEVELLSKEYGKPVEELTVLFTKRKIRILDDKGECINAPESKPRRKRVSSKASKKETHAGGQE